MQKVANCGRWKYEYQKIVIMKLWGNEEKRIIINKKAISSNSYYLQLLQNNTCSCAFQRCLLFRGLLFLEWEFTTSWIYSLWKSIFPLAHGKMASLHTIWTVIISSCFWLCQNLGCRFPLNNWLFLQYFSLRFGILAIF